MLYLRLQFLSKNEEIEDESKKAAMRCICVGHQMEQNWGQQGQTGKKEGNCQISRDDRFLKERFQQMSLKETLRKYIFWARHSLVNNWRES